MNDDGAKDSPEPAGSWDVGWEGHARAQRRRIAALPLWVRIDWLEEMQRVVNSLRASKPERRDAGAD